MAQNIPAFLINLDGSDERLAFVTSQMDKAGINFTRISAFDGRKVPLEQIEEYRSGADIAYLGRRMSGGEVGCYKSHIMAIEAFLKTGAEYGLVFEDDISVEPSVLKDVSQVIEYYSVNDIDWHIVNIGAASMKLSTVVSDAGPFKSGFELVHGHYFPMMASGLLWSRVGALAFLEQRKGIYIPIDTELREVMIRNNKGYAFWPPLVRQTRDESDIGARKMSDRHWSYGLKKQRRLNIGKLIAIKNKLFGSKP